MLLNIWWQHITNGFFMLKGRSITPKRVGMIFGRSDTEMHLHVKTFSGSLLKLDGSITLLH